MYFSELVLQGVRNFAQMQRVPLGQGFTVFYAESGAGKSTVVDVIVHLLYPNPTEPATTAFQAAAGAPCRVSLMMDAGADKYRLVKDLVSGSIALTKMDSSTQRFVTVTAAAAEILQYLTSQLRLPQRDILENVYLARDSALPSNMPRVASAPGAAAPTGTAPPGAVMGGAMGSSGEPQRRLPPSPHFPQGGAAASMGTAPGGAAFPGYQGMDPGEEILPDDPEEIKRQIETLKNDLSMSRNTDDLQFKLDGLQSEIFEIDQKLKGAKEATARVEQLESGLGEFEKLTELPENFEKKVREFEKCVEKLRRDQKRLDDEQGKWEKRARMSTPEPLRQNRTFLLSLVLGVVALGVGVAGFFIHESFRYVALLDIPAFGFALVVAVRHIDLLSSLERSSRRLDLVDGRREKLKRQFELETSMVRKTMMDLSVEKPGQIIEQYNRRNKLQAEIDRARRLLDEQRKDSSLGEAEEQRRKLQEELDAIEGQMVGAGSMMMNPSEMERTIQALRDKLQRIESGEPVSDLGPADGYLGAPEGEDPYGLGVGAPPGQAMASYGEVDLSAQPAAGPCQTMVKAAEDLFLTGRDRLEQTLGPRASQYIAALTNQAHPQLIFGPGGVIQCMDAGSGGAVDVSQLPAATQDLVYLGLKLTIIELFSSQQPVPLLLDDPFLKISPDRHELLGRMLADLGKLTQVILFTSQMTMAQHATASFRL
jgi:energy-coupling factor transporter ATP-binding protein EcfA2